jgi:hypothetical protein
MGESITITAGNFAALHRLSVELETLELYEYLEVCVDQGFFLKDELSISNVCQRLALRSEFGLDSHEELNFLARHFYEITVEQFESLSVTQLVLIISDGDLRIDTEDQLCTFLIDGVCRCLEYFRLFEFVQFEFLSEDVASKFTGLFDTHLDHLNASIWWAISVRFVHPVQPKNVNPRIRWESVTCGDGANESPIE